WCSAPVRSCRRSTHRLPDVLGRGAPRSGARHPGARHPGARHRSARHRGAWHRGLRVSQALQPYGCVLGLFGLVPAGRSRYIAYSLTTFVVSFRARWTWSAVPMNACPFDTLNGAHPPALGSKTVSVRLVTITATGELCECQPKFPP